MNLGGAKQNAISSRQIPSSLSLVHQLVFSLPQLHLQTACIIWP
jgi:hypothetical protein